MLRQVLKPPHIPKQPDAVKIRSKDTPRRLPDLSHRNRCVTSLGETDTETPDASEEVYDT